MIEYLEWDSSFFKRKIGKITIDQNVDLLERLLLSAKEQSYSLIYVFSQNDICIPKKFLVEKNGCLIDEKVLYSLSIRDVEKPVVSNKVTEYVSSDLSAELEDLAYESGKYSRFKLDSGFNRSDFYNLYHAWIKKSVSREIADNVFVIKKNDRVLGMITLKFKDDAEIGLLAVSPSAQGFGYGKLLIQKCIQESRKHHLERLVVPTQLKNIQACRFYEKCGFSVESITNIYHFWISDEIQ